jgi:hypothetical protein
VTNVALFKIFFLKKTKKKYLRLVLTSAKRDKQKGNNFFLFGQSMQQLRVAVIVVAILLIILFGVSLVRNNSRSVAIVESKLDQQPAAKISRSSAVIPDDMAAFPRRHVAFNPMVEVMQDVDTTFHQDYRTDQGTRARKRQAASEKSGGFQESELFARLTHDAPFMAPLSTQTEFQQTSIGETQRIPMQ